MLTEDQVAFYRENGYLVVPDVVDADTVAELRALIDGFIEKARSVSENDSVYDLELTHTPENPRVRRIKTPHKHHPRFKAVAADPRITDVLASLLGPDIRLHGTKLNMKSAGYGAAVEWHQDWAFYPHTNDDLLATGLLLDDCDIENGPLMVLPGTHKGPTFDHHAEGRFCGALDPEATGLDFSQAVPLTGKAGSMTIHHVRLVHGSSLNTSTRPRRLLLHEYGAADAWPLLGVPNYDDFMDRVVRGTQTNVPRMVPAPIRMPYPRGAHEGSIYENQRGSARRYFAVYEEERKTTAA